MARCTFGWTHTAVRLPLQRNSRLVQVQRLPLARLSHGVCPSIHPSLYTTANPLLNVHPAAAAAAVAAWCSSARQTTRLCLVSFTTRLLTTTNSTWCVCVWREAGGSPTNRRAAEPGLLGDLEPSPLIQAQWAAEAFPARRILTHFLTCCHACACKQGDLA